MEKYEVKQIDNLLNLNLDSLIKESKKDGFRFIERLVVDYTNGNNTFSHSGEGLFGVFSEDGVLVAIGGLNRDPFSNEQSIGRLRRFYVSKNYRRKGIGILLVTKIIDEAKRYYKTLVLHTDTEQADKFYISLGFSKDNLYPNSSHFMELKS
ncbi:GNAT family N-acetyltransferase [Litchfieldia salsa]|uniref:Acetyltransferase (GNAT) domain-containing protein n=1 Tax=Litchfieldia salsa TaxID=930152 RepID=A0A1H0SLX4_9BACI|nr:GNAT family N-acetyltransferase [Litchfieldia salsa]SDP42733.1 Acetyltransferase (GNAT) domain-containing protein [Litchfieldia salsa]